MGKRVLISNIIIIENIQVFIIVIQNSCDIMPNAIPDSIYAGGIADNRIKFRVLIRHSSVPETGIVNKHTDHRTIFIKGCSTIISANDDVIVVTVGIVVRTSGILAYLPFSELVCNVFRNNE